MHKIAQFYIIMAVVIAVVITGLITVVNYVFIRPEPAQFYDLTKQLEHEAGRVIEYGVYSQQDIATYVDNFVRNDFLKYAHEKDPDIGLIYIYGNSSELVIVNYGKDDAGVITETNRTTLFGAEAQSVSQIKIDIAGQQVSKKVVEEKGIFGNIRASFANTKSVQVNVSDKIYNFQLKGEQYFFAIVKSEKEGETYYKVI